MLTSLVRLYDQIPWLYQMRGIIRRWWGIEVIYVDRESHPIFLSGQPDKMVNRVCTVCLTSDKGRPRCLAAMADARAEVQRAEEAASGATGGRITRGCHLGMTSMVAPIVIRERDGGMIYASGFFDRALSDDQRRAFLDYGASIAPALARPEVLDTVPVLDDEVREHLADMLGFAVSAVVTLFSELREKEEEIDSLRRRLHERKGFGGLVGGSSAMQEVYGLVERVAANDCTVLVHGESGTGKELVANAIHSLSGRSSGPFVVQNCSAFNDNLLESELFGHVRGAFTGAVFDKKGFFEIAHEGTLFLDEVAEMSPALQAKLLRVLEDHTFWPVGASTPRQSDVRIVAATHRNLEALVKEGRFREDLFYRLNVIAITLPPLRERRSDIPALAEHFLERHGGPALSSDALHILCDYDWPGNVRELANELERIVVLSGGKRYLERDLISPRILEVTKTQPGTDPLLKGTLREAVEALEAQMIRTALERCAGNRSRAAKTLAIARSNLLVKMKAFGIG
jgi:transcriptional regulator with PAS, ATPase and Fis domain